MGLHLDPGVTNAIEIVVFALIGLLLWFRLGKLEEAILALAYRASRPLPSVAGLGGGPQELSSPTVHVPSSLLPWESPLAEDE